MYIHYILYIIFVQSYKLHYNINIIYRLLTRLYKPLLKTSHLIDRGCLVLEFFNSCKY